MEEKKSYVKGILPWSFVAVIVIWLLMAFSEAVSDWWFASIAWIVITIHTFVVSIIHIAKIKENKALGQKY